MVRDPAVHAAGVRRRGGVAGGATRLAVSGLTTSPITGPEGNVEFLIGGERG